VAASYYAIADRPTVDGEMDVIVRGVETTENSVQPT